MTPIVAIVGRPNVGKSTLFNRLLGSRQAIVHDEPGVTRDRHYADVEVRGRVVTLVDTGGFDPADRDSIGQGIARHVVAAVEEADVVLCVLDGQNPPTETDAQAVRMLRKAEKQVVYLANRVDHPGLAGAAGDLFSLGIEPLLVSALHGRGMAELALALELRLPERPEPEPVEEPPLDLDDADQADSQAAPPRVPHVALIGRPNAGKSSLLNRLAGDERSLVDGRPGTTRDPVDAHLVHKGKPYVVVDTAGIRRRARVQEGVESASVMQALRAVGRADVVVLLCDATEGLAEQDARLLGLCAERGRALVVALNKVDLMSAPERKRAEELARAQLHFAPWAPVMRTSNLSGEGVARLMQQVQKSYGQYAMRVPTAELNRFLATTVERTPPARAGSRPPRLFYMTQAKTSPPVFVIMCSSAEAIKDSYRRFIANQVRQTFGFSAVPLVIRYRDRRRRE